MDDFRVVLSYSAKDCGYVAWLPDLRWHSGTKNTRAEALAEAEQAAHEVADRWRGDSVWYSLPPLQPAYREKLVAYIDILGYSKLVSAEDSEAEAHIENIDRYLRNSPRAFEEWTNAEFAVKHVSDGICVSCLPDYLGLMLFELARFQLNFSTGLGVFLRGGVALGRHYQNDTVLFSEGMVTAYHLEQKTEQPRIAIADEVLRRADLGPDAQYCISGSQYVAVCDECKFVDYLQLGAEWDDWQLGIESDGRLSQEQGYVHPDAATGKKSGRYLELHRAAIVENWNENAADPGVVRKCRWLSE